MRARDNFWNASVMRSNLVQFSWYRYRAGFARRWSTGLSVVLIVGLVGGIGLAALSGARRTQSSFSTYFSSTHPSDLGVAAFTPRPENFRSKIASLGHVTKVEEYVALSAELLRPHHTATSLLPAISVVGSVGGEFFTQDRFSVTEGRVANPRDPHQVMVSQSAATLLKVRVGDQISLGFDGSSSTSKLIPTRVTVVGIGLLNSQVVQDDVERFPTYIIATPALTRSLTVNNLATRWYELRIQGGSENVAAVENEVFAKVRAYLVFRTSSTYVNEAQLALKPDVTALWAFGAIALLVGLFLSLQSLSRQLYARRNDLAALRALGADTRMTLYDGLISMFVAVALGVVMAVALCVALSPLFPIGPARQVFPSHGLYFDWTILAPGALGLLVVLGACTIALSRRSARRRTSSFASGRAGSVVVGNAMKVGLPASVVIGVRFALERGSSRQALSVRSVLYGAVLAIAIVSATLTFSSGLSTLVSHPSLYGWNWSDAIDSSAGYGPIPPGALQSLSHDPDVKSWTGVTFFTMELNGLSVPVLFADAPAAFSPPIVTGHAIEKSNQIVLGQYTMNQLHEHVGGHVSVGYGPPGPGRTKSLTIVGTSTLPTIGISEGLHTSTGTGAIIANGAFPNFSEHGYPKACNGPNMVFVRFRRGASEESSRATLLTIDATSNRTFSNTQSQCNLVLSTLGIQKPGQIRDYGSVGASPLVLASSLALGAIIALGFSLFASVRTRRREVAILKTLGFTQRQIAVSIACQASVAALLGVLVGVPLGILGGRWLWTLFANQIYVVPDATVPVGSILLVALGALVLANLVSAVPGRSAARTPTAIVLRAE